MRRAARRALARRSRAGSLRTGDRETLAYFRASPEGLALQPNRPDARLSLIHVEDLAEALALALDRPPRPVYEIDDGREGGYGHADMQAAADAGLGAGWSLATPRIGDGRNRPG